MKKLVKFYNTSLSLLIDLKYFNEIFIKKKKLWNVKTGTKHHNRTLLSLKNAILKNHRDVKFSACFGLKQNNQVLLIHPSFKYFRYLSYDIYLIYNDIH